MTSDTSELDRANSPHEDGRPSSGRLPRLDGVRGLAILLVLIHHGVTPVPFGGYVGVDVFFVLSGYLITGILLSEVDRYGRIRFRRFYTRRLIRLYPALLVVIAVLFVPGLLTDKEPGHVAHYLGNALAALTYTTPILTQFGKGFSPWRHTWSLGTEEIFYLLWPVALLLIARFVTARALRVGVMLALGGAMLTGGIVLDPSLELTTYGFRGAGLFFGCALALWLQAAPRRPVAGWMGALGVVGILAATAVGTEERYVGIAVALSCVASTLLLAHLATNATRPISAAFSIRPIAYLGLISYEVYLWHYPLLLIASQALDLRINEVAVWVLPVSLVLGAVTQKLLAKPTDRWKSRIPY